MEKTLQSFCKARNEMKYLLDQWDWENNSGITPAMVKPGSGKSVWWCCKEGHRWQATVESRSRGSGCPVCANRQLLVGENDFEAVHPTLASQWHPTKNGDLTPKQVFSGSKRKVWWQCEKGHEWQAAIASRTTSGTGCPICAGKMVQSGVNDLASIFPEVGGEWHPEKNGEWKPENISSFSNRRVWWQCEKGHEWQAIVAQRTKFNSGCPFCAGTKVLAGFNDLETKYPAIAEQWHPTLNKGLTPSMVLPGSHKRVWWQCAQGHTWHAVVYSRTSKRVHGCPVCAGRVSKGCKANSKENVSENL